MLGLILGKPGKGKTLTLTDIGYRKFKKDNPPIKVWFFEKILRKKWVYTIHCYSDYPIIFKEPKTDKEGNYIITEKTRKYKFYDENNNVRESYTISSIPLRIFNMTIDNRLQKDSTILIDEIQTKYDSMEYKDFPDSIAHFYQIHRHLDLDIFISSQSQSRVVKRVVVLSEEYNDIVSFHKIFRWAFLKIRRTWDMSANLENGVYNDSIADVEYYRKVINLKKVGKLYDSKYLRHLQDDSTSYPVLQFNSKTLSKEQLLYLFFPTIDEKKKLKNMRY